MNLLHPEERPLTAEEIRELREWQRQRLLAPLRKHVETKTAPPSRWRRLLNRLRGKR